jgi:hypothetical protein
MVQVYTGTEGNISHSGQQNGSSVQAIESYARALEAVQHLPLPMLTGLLHEIANRIGQQAGSASALSATASDAEEDPKHNSLKLLLGRMKTTQPPPTDEEVAQWLDEHRMEKYG